MANSKRRRPPKGRTATKQNPKASTPPDQDDPSGDEPVWGRLDEHGLNPRQRAFADAYLISGNATRSYKDAGYAVKSETVASQNGSKLLRNPNVAAYIESRHSEMREKLRVTHENVVREIAFSAFSDPLELVDEKGKLRPLRELPESIRRAISEIELDAEGKPAKIKLHGKGSAQDKLMRYLGLYKPDHDLLAGLVGAAAQSAADSGQAFKAKVEVTMSPSEAYRRMVRG